MNFRKLSQGVNKPLVTKIEAQYKISPKHSDDNSWATDLRKDLKKVYLWYCTTDHQEASYAHELLHIDMQMSGYNRIRLALAMDPVIQAQLPTLIRCMDNEFQHYKMYEKFRVLGFPGEHFYCDKDAASYATLMGKTKIPGETIISLAINFLSSIAPGGTMTDVQRTTLKQAFYDYEQGRYLAKLQVIEDIIERWKKDASFNAESYFIEFFKNLDIDETWVSYEKFDEKDILRFFPKVGFFVGQPFTIRIQPSTP